MRLWNKAFGLLIALFIAVCFSSTSFGQLNPGRTYFDNNNRDCDSINAVGYRVIQYRLEGDKSLETIQSFRMNGTLQSEKVKTIKEYPKNSSTQLESIQQAYNFNNNYAIRKKYDSLERMMEIQTLYLDQLEGAFEKFYANGKLKVKGNYHLNNYDDTLNGYYPNGSLKRIDIFCDGDLIEGKCFGTDGKDTTYFPYYQQASFPGGEAEMMSYISMNLVYPQSAINNHLTGKCYAKFKVNTTGKISDATIIHGVTGCPECDKEYLKVIRSMPNWIPFLDEEILHEAFFQLPITFNIE